MSVTTLNSVVTTVTNVNLKETSTTFESDQHKIFITAFTLAVNEGVFYTENTENYDDDGDDDDDDEDDIYDDYYTIVRCTEHSSVN